jgi:hypothetical protein
MVGLIRERGADRPVVGTLWARAPRVCVAFLYGMIDTMRYRPPRSVTG